MLCCIFQRKSDKQNSNSDSMLNALRVPPLCRCEKKQKGIAPSGLCPVCAVHISSIDPSFFCAFENVREDHGFCIACRRFVVREVREVVSVCQPRPRQGAEAGRGWRWSCAVRSRVRFEGGTLLVRRRNENMKPTQALKSKGASARERRGHETPVTEDSMFHRRCRPECRCDSRLA